MSLWKSKWIYNPENEQKEQPNGSLKEFLLVITTLNLINTTNQKHVCQ